MSYVDPSSGTRLPNGTYTGMLGVVQRGDADMASAVVRADTMDDSPVRLGPTLASADSAILGTKLTNETSSSPFVTDVIYNVDMTTYLFCLEWLLIIITILTTSQALYYRILTWNRVKRSLVRIVRNINWNIFGLVVDQEDTQLNIWSARFLWFHVCLGVFFMIFGYFWNTMSTDITVSRPATYIESIDYFLETPADERRKPIVAKDMLFHSAAQRADPKTKLGQLNQIINDTPGCLIFNDLSNMTRLAKSMDQFIHEVLDGKAVGIYPKFLVNTCLERAFCTLRPETMTRVHTAKNSMTPGTLHPILSHRIPRPMFEYIEYQLQTVLEFDTFMAILDYSIGQLSADNEMPRTLAYYKCIEHVADESSAQLKQFLTLYDIKHAIRAALILFAIALIVLGLELANRVLSISTTGPVSTKPDGKQRRLKRKRVIKAQRRLKRKKVTQAKEVKPSEANK